MAKFTLNYRKAISTVGIGIKSIAGELDADTATINAGAGVPTATEPDGSIYTRTDAASAAEAVYARIGAAWVAIDGLP